MTTLTQLNTWLKRPDHIRRVLVEITGVLRSTTLNPVSDQNLATNYSGTNSNYVTQLYSTYFARQPDSSGLAYWTSILDKSVGTRRQVELEFLNGEGSTQTFYLSNGGYTSFGTDSPANKSYLPIINSSISFNDSISLNGEVSVSYGDLELNNQDGSLDAFLNNYIWVNKSITIYIGDPNWPKSDFKILFTGYVTDVLARNRNTVNIVITDKLRQVNGALSEQTFINTSKNNTPELIPVCFGECFNVTPLLVNPSTLTYQVHTGPIEDIIEVRDNGIPVAFTKDLANGKFTLSNSPYGQITCSVQGAKHNNTYTNKIGETIKTILKYYGIANQQLTDSSFSSDYSDYDTSFTISGTYTRPIGFYSQQKENVLDICNKLAISCRSNLISLSGPLDTDSDVGKLKLVKLEIGVQPTSNLHYITSADIEEFSIAINEVPQLTAAKKVAYNKNYTVQTSGLAGGVPTSSKALFNSEWLYATASNPTTISNYSLTSEASEEQTLLINKTGAEAEVLHRVNLWSKPRKIYTMLCYSHMMFLQIGDTVSITNRRFFLNNSLGVVVSLSKDWLAGRVTVGVLV